MTEKIEEYRLRFDEILEEIAKDLLFYNMAAKEFAKYTAWYVIQQIDKSSYLDMFFLGIWTGLYLCFFIAGNI